jgi:Putative beta barrel porin-7 (BBP7)
MMKRFFWAIAPTARIGGLAVLAAATGCDLAVAADLPVITKAAPLALADPDRFWVGMDYLAWSVKGDRLPPLVTTSPAGTPLAQAGVLGPPGTTVLFGDSSVNGGWRSGGQLRAGYWFDPKHETGIEANFFGLERASSGFNANSSGTPILARPFLDATTNLQSSQLIAFPGLLSGSVTASETSRLYGAGALYRQEIGSSSTSWGTTRFSALVGYRFLHASDRLDISSTSIAVAGGLIPPGTVFAASDSFHASSNFHGLDLGVVGELSRGPWMLEWRAKVALGANLNEAQINGSATITAGGITTTSPGGLLALSSNIGSYSQTRFAAVPDLIVKAGYQFAPAWQVVAGYELLYWTGVQRPGGLVDTTVNPNLLPPAGGGGPQRPQAQLDTSSLLAQGFSFGIKHQF